jgi:retron-type reverse transcriptase
VTREEPVSESKPDGKPFVISKWLVWEAWRRVKANRGAAGVDEESILAFEANLRGNLYKVWNRMSSGSYFPPPVRAVEIPKKSGGSRMLGVPTVADRVAQTVAYLVLEPVGSLCFTRIPTGIGRSVRLMMRCGGAGRGVGSTTGFLIWT